MPRSTPALRTTVRVRGPVTTVCAYGDLDVATAGQLGRALAEAAASGAERVVVDLSGVVFTDAAGLNALLAGRRAVARRGGTLVLSEPSRMVRRMLALLDLTEALPVE